MDLSHMMALWLAGQSPGVAPGGCAVLYAPAGEGEKKDGASLAGLVYPFSLERWVLPSDREWAMRAGVGLIGELEYGPDGLAGFVPRLFSAVQVGASGFGSRDSGGDGAGTIGAQVNRGAGSIGLSDRLAFVDRFDAGAEGVLSRARVVGFVERGGGVTQSCADIAVSSFPVMFEKLVDYLRFVVSAQVAGNGYDDVAGALAKSDRPTHAVVVAGLAPVDPHLRGAQARLEAGDICHSIVYDDAAASLEAIARALRAGDMQGVLSAEGVSWLRQEVGN
ncbi:DUF5718 family protein [Phycisphaeraceae bacterium D3-23]